MVGSTNEDVDDISSDVFDIAIVWFGVSASDGIGKETFFTTSTDAGIVPKTVNTCRLLPLLATVLLLPRKTPLEFDVSSSSSSPERSSSSSSHFFSPFERRDDDDDDDATVCVPISLASSSSSSRRRRRPPCEQSVSASDDDDDDAPNVRLVALQSRRGG